MRQEKRIYSYRKLPPIHLTGVDLVAGLVRNQNIYYYEGTPNLPRLTRSLERALEHWPDFSATIVEDESGLYLDRNDCGVVFALEYHDEPLVDVGPSFPQEARSSLCEQGICSLVNDGRGVFAVMVSVFGNRRWALATTTCHGLCDGAGLSQFMSDWRMFHQGSEPAPRTPDLKRFRATPRSDPPDTFQIPPPQPRGNSLSEAEQFDSSYLTLSLSQIHRLKKSVNEVLHPEHVTTQDIISSIVASEYARQTQFSGELSLGFVHDIRKQLGLERYPGNMVRTRSVRIPARRLFDEPLGKLSSRIRNSLQAIPSGEALEELGYLQQQLEGRCYNSRGFYTTFSPKILQVCGEGKGIIFNNWSTFPVHSVDFGGTPVWFDVAIDMPVNCVMILPSRGEEIHLRLFFPKANLPSLREAIERRIEEELRRLPAL